MMKLMLHISTYGHLTSEPHDDYVELVDAACMGVDQNTFKPLHVSDEAGRIILNETNLRKAMDFRDNLWRVYESALEQYHANLTAEDPSITEQRDKIASLRKEADTLEIALRAKLR